MQRSYKEIFANVHLKIHNKHNAVQKASAIAAISEEGSHIKR